MKIFKSTFILALASSALHAANLSIVDSSFGKSAPKMVDSNHKTAAKSQAKSSYIILDQGLPLIAKSIQVDFAGKNLPQRCVVTFGENKEKFGLSSKELKITNKSSLINLARNGVGGRYIKLDFLGDKAIAIAEISIKNEDKKVYGYSQEKGLKQARSVHIGFRHPPTDAFYIEAKPVKSTNGTYFCNIGFGGGYFGVQQLHNGMKVSIFSIWDGSSNDPNFTAEEKQAKAIYTHEGTHVQRFGGEGSGIKSMMRYDWKLDEYSSYLVTVSPSDDPKRSYYSAFLKDDKSGKWIRMATFNAIGAPKLSGAYSFVEDFKRDYTSYTVERKAAYRNCWHYNAANKKWLKVDNLRFTADSAVSVNVDAYLKGKEVYIETGGKIVNQQRIYKPEINKEISQTPPKIDFEMFPHK